jgi:CubicO group peptidase (beta-lactamase class C family)
MKPFKTMLISLLVATASLLLAGCNSGSDHNSSTDYSRTISEGGKAANEILEQTGASSLSVALVADNKIVWAEAFGMADKELQIAPTVDTMFGIGSSSKMFATVAIMQLVDEGKVSLDEPVTRYIPTFSMLSPEYTQITVRMLLNHSAGFPGTDYLNFYTSHPYPGYLYQMQDSLRQARLKYSPGYMNLYANDGFTLIQQLVANVTGKSYTQYVQEEIFTPLGMNHSRYATEAFSAGSYVETYIGSQKNPFFTFNNYASGGLYTTPTDLAKFALMFLGKGTYNGQRILSEAAIDAMATDQTLGKFNPVSSEYFRFGLGWDTVSEGGLKAVNVTAWSKGGDIGVFGAEFLIVPDKKLAVAVIGASGSLGSASATALAEQIALQALVDQGDLSEMPAKLVATPLEDKTPTAEELSAITGYFASLDTLVRSDANADNSISFHRYDGNAWIASGDPLKMRVDDMFSRDANPLTEYYTVEDQEEFVAIEYSAGYGHYRDQLLDYQKVPDVTPLSDAWRNRLGKTWLLVNERSDVNPAQDPLFTLLQPEGLTGLLVANNTHEGTLNVVNPSNDDMRADMMPFTARDINDVVIFSEGDEEWIRYGSFIFRPQETVADISNGGTVDIGEDGYAQWRSFNSAGSAKKMTATTNGVWRIYDSAFTMIAETEGSGSVSLPASSEKYYAIFFGQDGDAITVTVE